MATRDLPNGTELGPIKFEISCNAEGRCTVEDDKVIYETDLHPDDVPAYATSPMGCLFDYLKPGKKLVFVVSVKIEDAT